LSGPPVRFRQQQLYELRIRGWKTERAYNINEEIGAMLQEASADSHTPVAIVEKRRMQGRDHPVFVGVPETYCLRCFILRRAE